MGKGGRNRTDKPKAPPLSLADSGVAAGAYGATVDPCLRTVTVRVVTADHRVREGDDAAISPHNPHSIRIGVDVVAALDGDDVRLIQTCASAGYGFTGRVISVDRSGAICELQGHQG